MIREDRGGFDYEGHPARTRRNAAQQVDVIG